MGKEKGKEETKEEGTDRGKSASTLFNNMVAEAGMKARKAIKLKMKKGQGVFAVYQGAEKRTGKNPDTKEPEEYLVHNFTEGVLIVNEADGDPMDVGMFFINGSHALDTQLDGLGSGDNLAIKYEGKIDTGGGKTYQEYIVHFLAE